MKFNHFSLFLFSVFLLFFFIGFVNAGGIFGHKYVVGDSEQSQKSSNADRKVSTSFSRLDLSLDDFGELFRIFANNFNEDPIGQSAKLLNFVIQNLAKPIRENVKSFKKLESLLIQKNGGGENQQPKMMTTNLEQNFANKLFASIFMKNNGNEFCQLTKHAEDCKDFMTAFIYRMIEAILNDFLHACRDFTVDCRIWWTKYRKTLKDAAVESNPSEEHPIPSISSSRSSSVDSGFSSSSNESTFSSFSGYSSSDNEVDKKFKSTIKIGKFPVQIRSKREAKKQNLNKPMKFFRAYVQYFREWRDKFEKEADKIHTRLLIEPIRNNDVQMKAALEKPLSKPVIRVAVNLRLLIIGNLNLEKRATKVAMRLYYYFADRKSGRGVNHAGVLVDGKEFHFSNNGGIEIFEKDGYKAIGYDVDHIKDYPMGETYLGEAEIQAVFDGFSLNEFAAGTYRSEVEGEAGTNNCLTFAHAFVSAIVEEKPQNWPLPLQKAFYGSHREFMKEMGLA